LLKSYCNKRPVPRDNEGNPILPVTIKGATIVNLGKIVHDRPLFHSKQYLWPAGFKSTRRLPAIESDEYTTYVSEIIDSGDAAPVFRVTPEDSPDMVFEHHTSSGVWTQTLKAIKKKSTVSVSGPEMFGYASPTIQMLFQELPNAGKCSKYVFKTFEESNDCQSPIGSPSTAMPDENDDKKTSQPVKGKSLAEVEKLKAEVRQLEEQLQARKRRAAKKEVSAETGLNVGDANSEEEEEEEEEVKQEQTSSRQDAGGTLEGVDDELSGEDDHVEDEEDESNDVAEQDDDEYED